jgi:hypothetical protein
MASWQILVDAPSSGFATFSPAKNRGGEGLSTKGLEGLKKTVRNAG